MSPIGVTHLFGVNMAINFKEYSEAVDTGLKAEKQFKKFLYRFKRDGVSKRGIIDYTDKDWDKRTRVSKAKAEFDKLKSKEIDNSLDCTPNSSLDSLAKLYFTTAVKQTKWTEELYGMYKLYVMPLLGSKKIKDIKKLHIDTLHRNMEESGVSKQTESGCSPRTIRKVIHQSLKPILEYALTDTTDESKETTAAILIDIFSFAFWRHSLFKQGYAIPEASPA